MMAILLHEFRFWLKNPIPYIFGCVIFGLSFLTMWGMSAEAPSGENIAMMNSYYRVNDMTNLFTMLLLFIAPAIMGYSIYRDYASRFHMIIYSYPILKSQYLLAKFGSAFIVFSFLGFLLVAGFLCGTMMPGVNSAVILPFDASNYLQLFWVYLIPNLFTVSTLVFAIVILTRNIFISFMAIILLVLFQTFGSGALAHNGMETLAALMDPLGRTAVKVTTKFWTLAERNELSLPLSGVILWNRVIWMALSVSLFSLTCYLFRFQQYINQTKRKNKEENIIDLKEASQIKQIHLPTSIPSFKLRDRFKTVWALSSIDFRYIVLSWPFFTILCAGLAVVVFQQYQMNPQDGIVSYPTTGNMLRIPMFIFSGIINLLTFLYVGVLIFRGRIHRMDGIIDSSPQQDWVFLSAHFLTILKMQFLLLLVIMLGGISVQLLSGFGRIEISHYLFELFVLHGIHFAIWTGLAFFTHTVSKNLFLGFFFTMMVPIGYLLWPGLVDYLGLTILKENIFQYNSVKGQFIGFDYSDFNGYGSQLSNYLLYKGYWLMAAILFLGGSLLWWNRGVQLTWKERWVKARSTWKGNMKWSMIVLSLLFLGTGNTIYYQEQNVSRVYFDDADMDQFMVRNELKYGHLRKSPQPKLHRVDMQMDIYPAEKSFKLSGDFAYTNPHNHAIDTIVIAHSLKENGFSKIIRDHDIIAKDSILRYQIAKLHQPLLPHDSLIIYHEVWNYPNTWFHHNSKVLENGTYLSSNILPVLGMRNVFLTNAKKRKKYGLDSIAFADNLPSDTTLLGDLNPDNNMGRIVYRCKISTEENQFPITMGSLDSSYVENGRLHRIYYSNTPIVNTMSWFSGTYEVKVILSTDPVITLYTHPAHNENDHHFVRGIQSSIQYCGERFGALEYSSLNLVEFPVTQGTYATLNGNVLPYSESYFLSNVEHRENELFNFPFYVSAHEMAHYWWGHRVDPANVKGSRVITEGMADYLAIRVVEETFGRDKARPIRKRFQSLYFEQRASKASESPLIYSSLDNEYLNYRKASAVFYTLSEMMGPESFDECMAKFEANHRYGEAPYPTSLDLVKHLKGCVSDSLEYLVSDLFEKICLYDNSIEQVKLDEFEGYYLTTIDLKIQKFKADSKGSRSYLDEEGSTLQAMGTSSLPLSDFVDIQVFDVDDQLIYSERILVNQIFTQVVVSTPAKPHKVTLDYDMLLLDVNREDEVWTLENR